MHYDFFPFSSKKKQWRENNKEKQYNEHRIQEFRNLQLFSSEITAIEREQCLATFEIL